MVEKLWLRSISLKSIESRNIVIIIADSATEKNSKNSQHNNSVASRGISVLIRASTGNAISASAAIHSPITRDVDFVV